MKTENETTTQAPAVEQQTKVPYFWSPTGYFDIKPLLEVLTKETGPDDMARILETVIDDLSRFYLENEGASDAYNNLYLLRQIRNALTRGIGVFCLDGPTHEETAWIEQKKREHLDKLTNKVV